MRRIVPRTTAFRIYVVRMDTGMITQYIADICGVFMAAVAKWEDTRSTSIVSNIFTICDAFCCDFNWIIAAVL